MGRRLFRYSGLAAVALTLMLAGSASAQEQRAPGRCCFAVSVDATWHMTLEYHGVNSGDFSGFYDRDVTWHTRFIARYTGGGLETESFGFGLGDADIGELSSVKILQPPQPPKDRPCAATGYESPGLIPQSGSFVGARAHVVGLARALDVYFPDSAKLRFTCSNAIEGPASHGVLGPSPLTLAAPSVKSLLHGKSFHRLCYQTVWVKNHDSPFPHDFTAETFYEVRFTYFPPKSLPARNRALHKRVGTAPSFPDDLSSTVDQFDSARQAGTWQWDDGPQPPAQYAPVHCK